MDDGDRLGLVVLVLILGAELDFDFDAGCRVWKEVGWLRGAVGCGVGD